MILKQIKYCSTSLLQYQSNKDWRQNSLLEYDQLSKKLRRKKSETASSIADGVYLSTFMGGDWNYRK